MTAPAKHLGVIVVGQSPRPDVAAEIRGVLPPGIAIDLRGALDGLSRGDIADLAPRNNHDALFTRLPGGEAVKLSKAAVERRAVGVAEAMLAGGTTVAMMCCTGAFPALVNRPGMILPSAVLFALVQSVLPRGRLGLFVPIPEQVGTLDDKWRREGIEITSIALTPGSAAGEIDAAAERMQARAPDLVVMDCMSYTQSMKDRVRQTVRGPVILGITAAARVMAELLA